MPRQTLVIVLGGGQGERLYPLTRDRAKPAVPFGGCYHWHIEIIPCITKIAGFEWGTGCYINPVLPESAAAFLREAAKLGRSASGGKVLPPG